MFSANALSFKGLFTSSFLNLFDTYPMNRIFNLIWSATKGRWIVVSEKVKGNGKVPSSPLRSLAVLMALFAVGEPAYAIDPGSLPSGGKITSGSGSIATSGTQMTVNQSSQQLIANWNSFNIGSNAAVRFNQPNTAASALNRITDQNPTQIMGSLSSNGQVYLLNPSGIIFGKTAQVNVGGLVATSLNMLDSDFLAGTNKFSTSGTAGSFLNQGTIKASDGGVVALIAPKVTNEGSITTNSGSVLLAAGNQVSLDFTGDGLISYTVDQGAVDAQVANKGLIKADGGLVVMTSKAADALRTATVTNTGVVEAHTIRNKAGHILLLSDMQNGDTSVAGTLDASAPNGGDGGFIETSGGRVKIADATVVTTLSPQANSGTWLLDPTDFTISSGTAAQTISGIGATTLSTALGSNNVTIETSNAPTATNLGDINVNAAVSWSANTLTLSALNNIFINANLNGSGTAGLGLNYGHGAVAAGNTSSYNLTNGAQVNLPAGQHFSTKQGSNGTSKSYTVITTIGTAADATTGSSQTLQGMARSGNLSGYFVLGSNIDATATATWNSDGLSTPTYAGFTPIGSYYQNHFTGTFDGLGHTISGLMIYRPLTYCVGLFGFITSSTVISNVGIVDVSVTGWVDVGGLVGHNSGFITKSYATGNVTGMALVGGLVGFGNGGSITNSYATDNVTGSQISVGGLVGENTGSITNSYAWGSVIGNDEVGGLVGSDYGHITNSYATGNVTGSGGYVGGLVGYNYNYMGSITNSFWDTTTSGQTTSAWGTGVTSAQIMQLSTFSSWNAATPNTIANIGGSGAVWRIYEGHTAPLLTCFLTTLTLADASDVTTTYNGSSQSANSTTTKLPLLLGHAVTGTNAGFYNGYYSIQQGYDIIGGDLSITPKALTMSGLTVPASKVYDGTTGAVVSGTGTLAVGEALGQGTTTDGRGYTGDSVSLSGTAVGTYNSKDVATASTVTYSGLSLTGSQAGNYTLTIQSPVNAKITQKTVMLKATKTYDGTTTLGAGTVTIGTGVMVNGITELLGYSGATASSKNVVDNASNFIKTITLANGTGGLAANYALPTLNHNNASVTITPKALTMSGLSVAASKVYDGTTKAVVTGTKKLATAEAVGQGNATDGKSYTGDTVSITGTAVGTYNSKDVASASTVTYSGLSLSGSQAGNYTLTIQSPAIAKITPKALTMSGLSVAASKVYDGTTNAVVTGTQKLAAGETAGTGTTADGKSYTGDTVSLIGTAVGTYNSKDVATASKVTFSGLSLTGSQSGNYTLTIQSPANAKITKKTVTLSATKTYDGTTTLGAGTVTIGTGVTLNGITELLGYSGATANSKNIADNATNYIKTITLLNGTGSLAANYALPTLNHVNAPVTIH